jgi:hypothetical protein
MRGLCRFLRTRAGRTYFAKVGLEVQPGAETMEVVDALPEHVDADAGEVNRHSASAWVAAALDGIWATLAYAQQVGVLAAPCRVQIDQLVGSPVDTREDVVHCAAGLAVWDAVGAPSPGPEENFDGQEWSLVFPARVPSPVQGTSR